MSEEEDRAPKPTMSEVLDAMARRQDESGADVDEGEAAREADEAVGEVRNEGSGSEKSFGQ